MTGYSKAEFLRAVLPSEQNGQYYCTFFVGKSDLSSPIERKIQRFHRTIDELIHSTDNPPSGVWNTFYLVAASRAEVRKKEFMVAHKAFFIDVDLKEYKDKKEAWTALQTFYNTLELPKPTMVDSGNGIHAYWILDREITTSEWCRVAEHFKRLCNDYKFYADPACTADASRVLRVPETYNVKDPNNPKMAVCVYLEPPIDFDLFKTLISYVEKDSFDELELKFSKNDVMSNNLIASMSQHKTFKHGLLLSLKGLGCEYLRIAYQNQEYMSEPQWRSALSIAQFCNDKEKAIHELSKRYPGYNREETEDKASRIEAPHTCETFRGMFALLDNRIPNVDNSKSACDACPHKKTIKSPISLCITHREAAPEDNIIEAVDETTGSNISVLIPVDSYPDSYFRGHDGGVLRKTRLDIVPEGETPSLQDLQGKLVYQYDLWVDSLQVDPVAGEVVVINLKQPRQPLVRFSIPLNKVTALSEFTDTVSHYGVSAPNYKELMEYIKAFVTKLQNTTDKVKCPASFGWEENYGSFVIGHRRYTSTGEVEFCLPSEATDYASKYYGMRNLMDVVGNTDEEKVTYMLDMWKNIFKLHARPNQEARLFAVFVSMGSPMFAFFHNIDGVILHLTNKDSGVGKSTIQHVANSVWCKPDKDTLMNLSDTKLSIFQHLGVLRNLVMCIDELTTIAPEAMCQFCFDVTSGRGRHRMEANTNKLRANVTEWRTPVITSGNNGLHQLMTQFKLVADGEAMRVLEVPVYRDEELQSPQNKAMTDKTFDGLQECYGVVGDILLKYYVTHADECRKELMEIRERLDVKAGLTQRERYYSALCAVGMLGAVVSKRLGIHDVDLDAFENWVVALCSGSSESASVSRLSLMDQLREFLHEMSPNTVKYGIDSTKILTNGTIDLNRNVTHVRQDVVAKHVYISYSQLKNWCTDKGVSINNMMQAMTSDANGVIVSTKLDITSSVPVKCLRVDFDSVCS